MRHKNVKPRKIGNVKDMGPHLSCWHQYDIYQLQADMFIREYNHVVHIEYALEVE